VAKKQKFGYARSLGQSSGGEVPLFWTYPNSITTQCNISGGYSFYVENQPDLFSRNSMQHRRVMDRWTDGLAIALYRLQHGLQLIMRV